MVPGEVSVPDDRSQSGPSATIRGTLASVSTLFTRVGFSFGRPGEQAEHERPRHPRQGRATLNDLLQTGLFSEQVEIRPKDHLERDATERVRLTHLFEGAVERSHLFGERFLDPDVAAFGTDRVCGDSETFQDLIRVGAEEETILERCRFSFRAVAYSEPASRAGCPYRPPFFTGREACTASATEATLGDLLDDCLGGKTQGDLQAAASAGVQIRGE